jgi:hypothetical protein
MDNSVREIDITPDPQVLYVLTYTSMRPIDSLCELIDNAIDSFGIASDPDRSLILIDLPSRRDISEEKAILRVRDNGPGLSIDEVESSLKAGFSSKYRFGKLGLFGVGFNIASGKLGMITKFTTAKEHDDYAIETIIDLQKLRKQGHYKIIPKQIPKPTYLDHGTVIEITAPWKEGNQNFGFMSKLLAQGRPTILRTLGRKYATILRKKTIRLQLGDDTVEPFEHCVWNSSRYVVRQKHGKIYARYDVDSVIHKQRRCGECGNIVPDDSSECIQTDCKSSTIQSVEERIRGWVGIQRFLDSSHFGIDLIRNGRVIRTLEKQAVFEFADENGETIVDYPIDDRTGRIIGEIHLDHVPVDPAKQDFERTSPEWQRAMAHLRGQSSLQPSQPGASENESLIYKLYQGYRKVRTPGRHDLYMGKWLAGSDKATLLSPSEVQVLRKKFEEREPGFFGDDEWWSLVEQADEEPVKGLKKCPEAGCGIESPEEAQECPACGYLFESKKCINKECSEFIPKGAASCSHCGANQIPTVEKPWKCLVCKSENSESNEVCTICGNQRGTLDPVSENSLLSTSDKIERLSKSLVTIKLANGELSESIDLDVYSSSSQIEVISETGSKIRVPLIRFVSSGLLNVFIDFTHSLFSNLKTTPEHAVSYEVAQYIFSLNQGLASRYSGVHSLANIAQEIMNKYWGEELSTSEQTINARIDELMISIRERLASSAKDDGDDIYSNLSEKDIEALVVEIVNSRRDPAELKEMISNGEFVNFLSSKAISTILRQYPHLFFDERVWKDGYTHVEVPASAKSRIQESVKAKHLNYLEAVILFSEKTGHHKLETQLADSACRLLEDGLT